MGSYCQYYVSADVSPEIALEIIQFANSLEDFKTGPSFQDWCWNRWSESSKWSEDGIMRALSNRFPTVMFIAKCQGDYNYTSYWFGGEYLDASQIWKRPKYPTIKEFTATAKRIKIEEKARRIQQEKDIRAKAILDAQNRLAALTKEKAELENKLSKASQINV